MADEHADELDDAALTGIAGGAGSVIGSKIKGSDWTQASPGGTVEIPDTKAPSSAHDGASSAGAHASGGDDHKPTTGGSGGSDPAAEMQALLAAGRQMQQEAQNQARASMMQNVLNNIASGEQHSTGDDKTSQGRIKL